MPISYELDPLQPDILVVEDDSELRETLLELLQLEGLVTIAAANGLDALKLAVECRPRLILLDMVMPVMDGRQFLNRCRRHDELSRVPVVAMSGHPQWVDLSPQVRAVMLKPLSDHELLATVRRILPAGDLASRGSLSQR